MVKNIIYSVGINFINLLFPVLLIPFYIKTFGLLNFGVIAIALNIVNIITVICEYSWFVSAPVHINKIGSDITVLNRYISVIVNSKLLLLMPCIVLLALCLPVYHSITNDTIFTISVFLLLFSRSQNILSIFVGLNKVKVFFIISSIFKLSCIALIFILLKQESDYKYLLYILAFADIAVSVTCILYLWLKSGYIYTLSTRFEIISELKEGSKIFYTNLIISILLNSATPIAGYLFNAETAGIFNIAEKIISLAKLSINVLFQGVYHKACQIGTAHSKELKAYFKKVFISYFAIYMTGTIVLLLFPDIILDIYSQGKATAASVSYLIGMCAIPLITALNQPAYMSLVLHNKKNVYFYAYFTGMAINLLLAFTLTPFTGIYGIITGMVIAEFFICIFMNYTVILNKTLNFFKSDSSYEGSY